MASTELKSIYDIREDEIEIKGKAWDDDLVQRLAYKKILQWEKSIDYWEWLLKRGRDYMDKYSGKILTQEQIDTYEQVEDKVVIQPPIMKSPIRALLGHTIKSRKSGTVTTEGGQFDAPAASSDEITTINMVLKDLEIKTKEKYKVRDAVHDAYVSCYPNFLCFERRKPSIDNPRNIDLIKWPFDSVTVGPPTVREPDGSDIKEVFLFDLRSQSDLEENFPEMKKQIRAHWENGDRVDDQLMSSLAQWDGNDTSESKETLFSVIDNSRGSMTSLSGLVPTVMHIFPIKRKEEVWVNIFDEEGNDYHIRPPSWNDDKWAKWVEENKEVYQGPYERDVTVLWVNVFTTSGLVLANDAHWFQECGHLPGTFWIPCMISGVPSGPAADMADDAIRNCVAQIEWLDDVRKGHGILALIREGSVKNMDEITEEANKAFGVGIVSKDFPGSIRDAYAEIKRDPSDVWRGYAEGSRQDMYENTRLNETMQGQAAPRQAAIAKETEIAQALTVNAIYIDNINSQWERHQNLKCALIPYVYDQWDVIQIYDEEKQEEVAQEINTPQFDSEGNKVGVINDVTARRYKWRTNPVDDSPTAKARQMEDALMIINGAAGPLLQKDPTGKLFSRFLMAFPNEFLNKAGKGMAEDVAIAQEQQSKSQQMQILQEANVEMIKAQADMVKAQKTGVSVSFTGEQLAQYPNLYKLYLALQQQGQGQVPQQQQPQPQQPQMTGASNV